MIQYFKIAETEEINPRFRGKNFFTLREVANRLGIEKSDRNRFFLILREEGLITHNNELTYLGYVSGVFKERNKKEDSLLVTLMGTLVISDIMLMRYMLY